MRIIQDAENNIFYYQEDDPFVAAAPAVPAAAAPAAPDAPVDPAPPEVPVVSGSEENNATQEAVQAAEAAVEVSLSRKDLQEDDLLSSVEYDHYEDGAGPYHFEVLSVSDTSVKVRCGWWAWYDGYERGQVGLDDSGAAAREEWTYFSPTLTATAAGFIYLKLDRTSTPELTAVFGTSIPADAADILYKKIAVIQWDAGAITSIDQSWTGGNILVTGLNLRWDQIRDAQEDVDLFSDTNANSLGAGDSLSLGEEFSKWNSIVAYAYEAITLRATRDNTGGFDAGNGGMLRLYRTGTYTASLFTFSGSVQISASDGSGSPGTGGDVFIGVGNGNHIILEPKQDAETTGWIKINNLPTSDPVASSGSNCLFTQTLQDITGDGADDNTVKILCVS